ncbi:hypothetical protein BT69DRAFT_1333733 [Atractiella rhizophila]|nr:hypothetical protein BT69DRAFT_1333733 [Atractiella rhizophila]
MASNGIRLISSSSFEPTLRLGPIQHHSSAPLSHNESFFLPFGANLDFSLSLEDPTSGQYTRPYSWVFLPEKHGVLGMPDLLVCHMGKRKMVDWWGGSATWGWRIKQNGKIDGSNRRWRTGVRCMSLSLFNVENSTSKRRSYLANIINPS